MSADTSIAAHTGFQAALAASDLTASEANALRATVAALEELFAGPAQGSIASGPSLEPSHRGQAACPMCPVLFAETYIASALLRTPCAPFGNPSPFSSPTFDMTAGEIMAMSARSVEP